MEPLTMALLAGGGQALGSLGDWLGGGDQRKHMRQQMSRQTDLYNLFRYGGQLGQDVISPRLMQQMLSNYRQMMGPQMANQLWGASRHAGLSSPQTWRMFMQQWLPQQAGFANQLGMQNIGLTQQRDAGIRSLLARLAGA